MKLRPLHTVLILVVVFITPGVTAQSKGQSDFGPVYRVGNGVTAPRAVYTPDPEYSEEARQAKCGGEVVLWLIVGADGNAHDVKVVRPFGLGLDEKAVEAVKQWRFEPATKDGQPVAVQVNVETRFRLSTMNVLRTEILSGTEGVHSNSFVATAVHDVRLNWCKLIPQDATEKREVTIQFSILKDGQVADVQTSSPSGDNALGRAALGAINASSPFRPLPSEFGGDYIRLRMHFLYNSTPEIVFHRSAKSPN